jgi:hypothetical protein
MLFLQRPLALGLLERLEEFAHELSWTPISAFARR